MLPTIGQRATADNGSETAAGRGRTRPIAGVVRWLGSRRVWLASAALFIVFAVTFFASSAPFSVPEVERTCGQAPLDMRFSSSGAEVADFLDACGPAGRHAYRNMQLADLVYPLVVGVFMASSLALLAQRLFPRRDWASAVPAIAIVATSFDYLENWFAWHALRAYPDPPATSGLLGLASAGKNVASWTAGLLIMAGVGAVAVQAGLRLLRTFRRPG